MPRNGSGTLSAPPGIRAAAGEVIRSAQFNAFLDDWVLDGNNPRPLTAGGTGATSKTAAQAALGVVPQASTSDNTAGSLLLNGAWGLGGTVPLDVPSGDCDLITRTGFYKGVASETLHMPTDANAYAIFHVQHQSNVAVQQAIRSDGITYVRGKNFSSSFSPWRIFETVVEADTNANGTYTKYASGKIVCTHTLGFTAAISTADNGGFRTATQTWTFPKAFVSSPKFVSVVASGDTAFGAKLMGGTDETQAFIALTAVSSQTSASRACRLYAEGI